MVTGEGGDSAETDDGLMELARYGEHAGVVAALAAGADPAEADERGNTALHLAAANGHLTIVDALLGAGAKMAANAAGNTALHWAAENKADAVVERLLRAPGADVLAPNAAGHTPLAIASALGRDPVVALMLRHESAAALDEVQRELDGAAGAGCEGDGAGVGEGAAGEAGEPGAAAGRADGADEDGGAAGAAESGRAARVVEEVTLRVRVTPPEDVHAAAVVCRQVGIEWADADPPPGVGAGAGAGAEDATGVYLWGSAVLLARWLVQKRALLRGKVVLELGAGCGLPSLAAWLHTEASLVLATDLFQPTVENLARNVELNSAVRGRRHMVVQRLDWGDRATWPVEAPPEGGGFDVCIGSDLVYDAAQVPLLCEAIDGLLAPGGVLLYAAPARRDGLPLLLETLEAKGFACVSFPAPAEWYGNPLEGATRDADFALHLPELRDAGEGRAEDANGPVSLYSIHKPPVK